MFAVVTYKKHTGVAMIIAMAYTHLDTCVQPPTRLINRVEGEHTQDGCQACHSRCLFVYIITRYYFTCNIYASIVICCYTW